MKQWKRLAALSSAIVMAAATLTYFPSDTLQNIRLEISASAETTTEPQVWIEDNLTWKLYEDGTLNISGTGAMKDYNAAENLSPAYMNSNIKKVVIEKGVTRIGELAFFKCSSLTNITIPDSVTCIAYAAFGGCTNLTDITIPDSVTSIGMEVFLGCNSLTSITIPNGITSIGDDMFSNCWSLTSITIPDSVTSIGMYAFSECSSLTSITIPKSVTSIGNSAFRSCNNLTVYLENGSTLTSNDLGVDESKIVSYWNEDNLTWTLTADGTLTISGTGAMKGYNNNYNPSPACGNSSVKKVVIEDGVTSIGYNAFYGCSTLTGITIPDSVTSIGGTAFQYCSSLSSITIPNSVTSIGSYAFSGCGLTSITIPDSVTSIGSHAFYDCSSLTSITIPDSVTSIGSHAFYDCSSLTSITIPNSVTSIGEGAFHYCSSLTSITIPDSVTNIEDYAFYKCSSLTSITIPDSVTSIGDGAFKNCSGLTSITIPKSVTSIGDSAFDGCTNLTVYLENGSTLTSNDLGVDESKIVSYHRWNEDNLTWKLDADGTLTISGTGAMKNYDYDNNLSPVYMTLDVKKVVIEDGVTSIGTVAFPYCSSLISITIPDSVTSIGESAFEDCSNLTSITIPDSVTSIGEFAFSCCGLTSITIPDSVTSIGSEAFSSCFYLETISLSCKSSLKKSDFGGQADLVSYTSHTLKKTEAKDATCSESGNKAYWTCEHCGKYFLSDDANPETAKAVEQAETIIPASHKLTKVKEEKAPTCTEDGNKEYWTCEHCGKYFLSDDTNPETAKAVELSETVIPALNHKNAITSYGASKPTETEPGYSGDRYCPDCNTVLEKGYTYWVEDNLTWKLDAKGTLTISGTGAMKDYDSDSNPSPVYNNWDVEKIVIEDGVTSIGDSAFERCNSLTSITIPNSVTSIGIRAFNVCRNLTNITIPDNVTSIGDSAFHYCENLTSVTIPNSVTSIGDFAFYNCRSLTSITIPDRVTSIGNFVFEGCKGLTSITIPDSITSIGDFAFRYCTSLTSITIPDRVTSIGNAAFESCSSLTSITIPDSVTSIGNSAFDGCKGLTSITIPDSVTSIGNSAFLNCSSLTSITIPDSITSIGNSAFSYCRSLTSITIPGSVTSIGSYAFSECSSLTGITIPDSVTSIGKYAFRDCSSLTSITIPDSVTSIGKYTFKNCTSLTSITIPDSVTSIGDSAFSDCTSLTAISLSCKSSLKRSDFGGQANLVSYTSHTLKKTEAKDATCSEDGNKAYWTCEHCGKYFLSDDTNPETAKAVEQSETVIPASHKLTKVEAKAKTCTEDGNKEYWTCEHCKKYFLSDDANPETAKAVEQSETVISASHKLTKVEAKAATCTEDGNKEYWTCEHCGKYFLSDDTNPETAKAVEQSETVIPASHKLTKVEAKAATCTEDGNKEYWTCEHCKKYFLSDDTNPETAKAVEQSETVIPASHKLTKVEAKAPTCTEDGNKEYWTCEHCGKYFLSDDANPETAKAVEQSETVIPASHKLTKVDAKAVTCAENGNKEYWICEHCKQYFLSDDTNPETAKAVELSETVIPALNHKNAITSYGASKPTETAPGYSGDLYCPDCDTVLEKGYTYWNEGNLTWKLYEDGTLTISGTGAMKDYNSTDNLSPAYCNSKVKKVVIEDGVTSIGNYAFYGCLNLISITIPDGVTSIGESAFCNCTSLTSITIPDGVTSIGESAFYGCNSLTSITIPGGVTSIENGTFYNCSSLTDIVIPNSVTSIKTAAFFDCSSLPSITIPDSVTSIGTYAFYNCRSLTSITIPDSVTSIGNDAFYNCSSLKTISLSCKSSLKKNDFGGQANLVSYTNQHLLTKTEAKDATCSEDGNKEYWTCEHCKKYFLSDDTNPETAKAVELSETVIPASHKLTKVEAKDATCTEDGNKEYWTCEHCKKYFLSDDTNPETAKAVELSETVIPASHKLTKVEAKTATCTENGNIEYWTCEHCGKYFLSDDTNPATAKAVEQAETVISASHKLTKVEAKDATCTEDGNKAYWTCEHCGKYFLSDDTNPETAKAVEQAETVISASHKLTKVEAKDATCTEDGNKAYWTCEHCKKYFLSDDTNPATAKAVEQSETIISASHKLTKVEAKDATCTEDGNKAYWTCEHCGKYFLSDDTNPETAKAVELSETVIPALIQVATTTTPIKCVYGQDMNKIDLRDYVKNTDVVGEVTVKVATDSTLPDGMKLDGSNLSGKPAKAYEDGKEVTFTFTAENGSTANLTLLFLVAKAEPTVEVAVGGDSHTEGDLVGELELILSENSTKGVVELVSEIKALVAGKNTFTWKFTPEDENNYHTVTGTVVVNAQTTTTTTTTTKATTTTTTKATTTTTAIPSYGDVNLDGKVDILDAVFLNKYLATLVQFSDAQIANADCCQDGVLNDQDTTALVHFIILLIDDLPVQPTEK